MAGSQITGAISSAASFTGALAGDVTGSQGATVVSTVGGVTAVNVAAGASSANAATFENTANTIVKRDAFGNFTVGTIVGNLNGLAAEANTAVTADKATSFTGFLAGDVTGTQSATTISASTVTGKALTGFVSGSGTIGPSDTILTATNKLSGNISAISPPCFDANTRYKDCGDGTVYDKTTGLIWEKKEACGGVVNLSNPHCVANTYTWTAASPPSTEPTGTLYSDFLQLLHGLDINGVPPSPCFAGQCDWRIPTQGELRSILLAPYPCFLVPCIDAIFGPTGAGGTYTWSSSSSARDPSLAWSVNFLSSAVVASSKPLGLHARAVRSGR